ncbi:hypothetical protein Bbelb_265000 [Branchiostoma belcheri]|nr:hypothetical protein Bbelb_265000 [Branchiostoma belcheri]
MSVAMPEGVLQTCSHQMKPDKTPQVTVSKCQMRPDKTPQVTRGQMRPDKTPQVTRDQMRPDKTPEVTRDQVYPEEQQCSCTCLHQMNPEKTPQDTVASDADPETRLSGRKNQTFYRPSCLKDDGEV